MSRPLAAIAVALAALALPAVASAGTVDHEPGSTQLTFSGTGTEKNTMTITVSGGTIAVRDTSSGMGQPATSNCTSAANGFDCPAAGVTQLDISLGGGDDAITVSGSTPATITGGDGADSITGGNEPDSINGDDGSDAVQGGGGDDTLLGGAGNDDIDGGAGNDLVSTGPGPSSGVGDADTFTGGSGTDTVTYISRTTGVNLSVDGVANDGAPGEGDNVGSGFEDLVGGAGADRIAGGSAAETLDGSNGPDTLDGGDGNDTLSGGGDNDSLNGGPGSDDLSGGAGTDTADFTAATAPVTVTLDDQAGDGQLFENDNVHADVENLNGSAQDDTFTGSSAANTLNAGGGENFLDGRAGADQMTGGALPDTLVTRDGSSLDRGTCGAGFDFVIADRGDTLASDCDVVDRFSGDRPKLGRIVAVRPRRGSFQMRVVRAHRFVPLTTHANLPTGSTLDATRGTLRLTLAGSRRSRPRGDLGGGEFLVKQRRRRSAGADLTLAGGDFSVCTTRARRAFPAARRRTVRRLFGRTHGRFRTRGRNSVATSRGTVWTMADRCDGTLTTVKSGTVVVRDLVKHRTVVVRAGHSYLAKRAVR